MGPKLKIFKNRFQHVFTHHERRLGANFQLIRRPPPWGRNGIHQRFGPYLGILGSQTRDLGADMACGTERRVSCESNAVLATSGVDLVGLLHRAAAPTAARAEV